MAYLYDNGKEIMYTPADKSLTARKYSGYKRFIGAKSYYRVEQNGKFGVVDDKDNLILPFKYSNITEAITSDNGHLDGAFHVWDADGRIGVAKVINGKGKEIVPRAGNYDRIWGYESYGVIVVKNGKRGLHKREWRHFLPDGLRRAHQRHETSGIRQEFRHIKRCLCRYLRLQRQIPYYCQGG